MEWSIVYSTEVLNVERPLSPSWEDERVMSDNIKKKKKSGLGKIRFFLLSPKKRDTEGNLLTSTKKFFM